VLLEEAAADFVSVKRKSGKARAKDSSVPKPAAVAAAAASELAYSPGRKPATTPTKAWPTRLAVAAAGGGKKQEKKPTEDTEVAVAMEHQWQEGAKLSMPQASPARPKAGGKPAAKSKAENKPGAANEGKVDDAERTTKEGAKASKAKKTMNAAAGAEAAGAEAAAGKPGSKKKPPYGPPASGGGRLALPLPTHHRRRYGAARVAGPAAKFKSAGGKVKAKVKGAATAAAVDVAATAGLVALLSPDSPPKGNPDPSGKGGKSPAGMGNVLTAKQAKQKSSASWPLSPPDEPPTRLAGNVPSLVFEDLSTGGPRACRGEDARRGCPGS
jgi:hypothetical protein